MFCLNAKMYSIRIVINAILDKAPSSLPRSSSENHTPHLAPSFLLDRYSESSKGIEVWVGGRAAAAGVMRHSRCQGRAGRETEDDGRDVEDVKVLVFVDLE
ncbi:hypothetical protein CPB84DRAFT_1749674 [Gymnopilus junonius]|uniref:Uncharacterized protein n=1 Tax=Gymnopilus junonius TaxID=109634 RepID=A0A9P5NI40_GYMJU|nr:hypothetical protein CPB84DRAFT_1749674 [Gymnopilus junonius]